jgi:hypothetical protein
MVADRGMVNKKIIERLESPSFRIDHIFGCRMRRRKEVKLNDDRYIICYNPEQARKDAEDRKA